MTEETAEKNNVVAAECCYWCKHYAGDGTTRYIESLCNKLRSMTWATDVCNHFTHEGDSMKKTDKEEKYVTVVTVNIPKDMFEKLKKKAQEDFRDLNMEILYAIDKMLNDVATISYTPVWNDKKWEEYWPGDKNTTPIRPVNFPVDPNKNWDGSPKVTCSNA